MAGRHRLNGRRVITKRRGVEMVDIRTLVAHVLSDAAVVAGRRGGGRYVALCGTGGHPREPHGCAGGWLLRVLHHDSHSEDDAVTGAPKPPLVPDAPHGTLRGYSMGCRCLFCHSAEQAATATTTGTSGRAGDPAICG
ncbi:MAG: hypothetical protein ACRDS1_12295 [Pseudonocardiaceae bacterium]